MSDTIKKNERRPAIVKRTVESREGATIKLVRLTMAPWIRESIERRFAEGREKTSRS